MGADEIAGVGETWDVAYRWNASGWIRKEAARAAKEDAEEFGGDGGDDASEILSSFIGAKKISCDFLRRKTEELRWREKQGLVILKESGRKPK